MLPRISMNEPINPNLNACATRLIIERINPIQIDLGRFHAHQQIVSCRLQYTQGQIATNLRSNVRGHRSATLAAKLPPAVARPCGPTSWPHGSLVGLRGRTANRATAPTISSMNIQKRLPVGSPQKGTARKRATG